MTPALPFARRPHPLDVLAARARAAAEVAVRAEWSAARAAGWLPFDGAFRARDEIERRKARIASRDRARLRTALGLLAAALVGCALLLLILVFLLPD